MSTQQEDQVDVQDLVNIKDQMLAQANASLAMALARVSALQKKLDALTPKSEDSPI